MAGAVGPLGVRIEPLGPTSFAEARAVFREQVEALLEAGVDLLILETFADLNELREAIYAAREAAGRRDRHRGPGHHRRLRQPARRHRHRDLHAQRLDEWPADVIGFNCSAGPKVMLETIERMVRFTGKPHQRHAQRGPSRATVEGRKIYLCSPEYMAQYARRFLWAGVRIIGGCCGTTPEHIKLIRSRGALAAARHTARPASAVGGSRRPRRRRCRRFRWPRNPRWAPSWPPGKFVAFVEILPPRGVDAAKEIAGAQAVRRSTASTASTCPTARAPARA